MCKMKIMLTIEAMEEDIHEIKGNIIESASNAIIEFCCQEEPRASVEDCRLSELLSMFVNERERTDDNERRLYLVCYGHITPQEARVLSVDAIKEIYRHVME